jgi:hypothetical protein
LNYRLSPFLFFPRLSIHIFPRSHFFDSIIAFTIPFSNDRQLFLKMCYHMTDGREPLPRRFSQLLSEGPTFPEPNRATVKKSKWPAKDDALLSENISIYGLTNWAFVAGAIPGRNGKQCRERWVNQLAPALSRENWTRQEDFRLVQYHRVCGNAWCQIAQYLPGRSANAVKNRWCWLSRHTLQGAVMQARPRELPIPEIATTSETRITESEFWIDGSEIPEFGLSDDDLRSRALGGLVGEDFEEELFPRFPDWDSYNFSGI